MYALMALGWPPADRCGERLTVIDVAAAEDDREPERIVLISPEVIFA